MRDVMVFIVRGESDSAADEVGSVSGTADAGTGFSGGMAWEWQ